MDTSTAPTADQVIATLRDHAAELRQAGICHVGLFGSLARGEASPASDIDLVVELDPAARIGMIRLAGIERRLVEILGWRVDLLPEPIEHPVFVPMWIGIGGMSSSHDPAVCLADILDNIERIRSYVGAMDRTRLSATAAPATQSSGASNGSAKLRFAWATKRRGGCPTNPGATFEAWATACGTHMTG